MWKLFKTPANEGESVAVGSLRSEVEDLKAAVRGLEGRVKGVEAEWDNAFLKLRRIVGHVTKTKGLDDLLAQVPGPAMAVNVTPKIEQPEPKVRRVEEMTRDEIASLQIP